MSEQQLVVGFGCASLYGVPGRRDRRAVLETAYDHGIRHFDVAPMYGLGIAERELGEFLAAHPDARVATKFGIAPTPLGTFAGLIQPPIRRVMNRASSVKSTMKKSGTGPGGGLVGRLLYRRPGFTVAAAQRGLDASLRALGRDHVDYLLLHEPAGALPSDPADTARLADFLDAQCTAGTVGLWGPAGTVSAGEGGGAELLRRASVHQLPYNLVEGWAGSVPDGVGEGITFGFLSGALAEVRRILGADPELRQDCSDLLGADLADPQSILGLLVQDAVGHDGFGITLFSSTKPRNVEQVCAAACLELHNVSDVAKRIRERSYEAEVVR